MEYEISKSSQIGKQVPGKPRPIIARFLNYPDRERIMSLRKNLEKNWGYGIGPDLPKVVVDMRKRLIPKLIEARKEGKRAFLVVQNLTNSLLTVRK